MSELGPDARSILDGGRDGDDPTPADRKRVRAAVLQAIAVGSVTALGSATAAGASAGGTLLGVGWKTLAATIALGALGTVTVVASTSMKTPSGPSANGTAAPALTASPRQVNATTPASVGGTAIEAVEPAPAVAPATGTSSPSAPVASATPRPARSGSVPTVVASSAPPEPAQEPDTLRAEAQRLRDAQIALKGGDPDRALALLDEHGSAGSQLREERAAGRVFALCDLGRVEEARAAAAKFLAESPRSPLADRVRSSCAAR